MDYNTLYNINSSNMNNMLNINNMNNMYQSVNQNQNGYSHTHTQTRSNIQYSVYNTPINNIHHLPSNSINYMNNSPNSPISPNSVHNMVNNMNNINAIANVNINNPNTIYVCTNCGKSGHSFRYCTAPVTSYGVIAIRMTLNNEEIGGDFCTKKQLITGAESSSQIQFLLIQRRDSLSFVEFIRGKYATTDTEYLIRLFKGMTKKEHAKIREANFDELWKTLWGDSHTTHKSDFDASKKRFEQIVSSGQLNEILIKGATEWNEPEWGFPKGRRNPHESDISCATREFFEETNLRKNQYSLINNIGPVIETFFGSNHVHYCHKYYLAICDPSVNVKFNRHNSHMIREISDIRWCTLDDALQKIRPENVEKREILLKVARILRNFCPVNIHDFMIRHAPEKINGKEKDDDTDCERDNLQNNNK